MRIAARRQITWGLADQALSSITNFALTFMVARTAGAQQLGAFGVLFATYVVLLGVNRSITSEPLVVRHSASPVIIRRAATQAATGAAVLLGIVAGLGCLGVAWVSRGQLGSGLLALTIGLPGLLLQDTWRFAFFADKRGGAAFINDLSWAAALVPAEGLLLLSGRSSIFWLTLAWGGAATCAAVVGALQARTMPRVLDAMAWLRRNWTLWRCYSPEAIATSGVGLAVIVAIGWFAGLEGVGAIQAAGLLLGPLNVLFMATRLAVLPGFVRLIAQGSREGLQRMGAALSSLLAVIALIAGAALLALPQPTGEILLGTTWNLARTVLGPLVIMTAGSGVITGAELGLRALAAAPRSLYACFAASTVSVVSAALGAWLGGTLGAAWGLAIGRSFAIAIWWMHLRRAVREHLERQPSQRRESQDASASDLSQADHAG